MIEVSVIVPVRNAAKCIKRCAGSLFEQTLGEEMEFVFVDDASADDSADLLAEALMNRHDRIPRMRLLHHSAPRGREAARNTGLASAVGEFVAFCDAEDWVETDMYARLLSEVRCSGADAVFCDYIAEYEGWHKRVNCKPGRDVSEALRRLRGRRFGPAAGNMLLRRSVIARNSIMFPEEPELREEAHFVSRFLSFAEACAYVHAPMYHRNMEPVQG